MLVMETGSAVVETKSVTQAALAKGGSLIARFDPNRRIEYADVEPSESAGDEK